jgi:hypothetical protein
MQMTPEELTTYSGEHLFHEFKMFWWTTSLLIYMDDCYMHDALLESYLVHLRNLINFLCRERKREDVIAVDFIDEAACWYPTESPSLANARDRADTHLSHISGKRKYVGAKDREWDIVALFNEIKQLADRFVDWASPEKLHPNVRELVKPNASSATSVVGLMVRASHSTATEGPVWMWSPYFRRT